MKSINQRNDKVYISKFYDAVSGQWLRVDTINNNDRIHIFDSDNTYEGNHDIAYVLITNEDYVVIDSEGTKHYVEITLKDDPNGNNYQLQRSYSASKMADSQSDYAWKFDNGKSAGVCVDDNQFYKADPTDLRQPFSDAFVTFEVSANGVGGSGVVPYLPEQFFSSAFL